MTKPRKGLIFTIAAALCMGFFTTGQLFGQSQQIVVNVEAMDHAFDVDAPDELPTGWITFVLNNQMAEEVHEISFARLPDGVTYDEYLTDYMGAWETLLSEYQQGIVERDEISARVNELLPAWASDIEYVNARGLISPGRTAEKTIYLEPGKYTMGCWMKTEDGLIHIVQGMHRELNITEEPANSPEPNPESRITLHEEDIEIDWVAETGKQAFEVDFKIDESGQSFHNNIHLIRLDGEPDWVELNNWLDWYHPGGLRTPSPADYLGGFETVRDGSTVYFSLEITDPGEYAWVVFVSRGQGLHKKFTVK